MAPPDPLPARIAALEAELAALRSDMQEFTYTVSHDLRAPLRHIVSYVQLVHEDAGALLPPEVQGFLHTITDSAQHLGALLDGLTELSRVGAAPLNGGEVPLEPVVQDIVQGLMQSPAAGAIAWELPSTWPTVQADPWLLHKALHCVLDNAVKFSAPSPAPRIRMAATVQHTEQGDWVTLTVQDNGVGYNPALQDRLFKPFGRLHTARQFPGIGMGLAVVRKALERMGGSAQAEASLQAGCTLHLTLRTAGTAQHAA